MSEYFVQVLIHKEYSLQIDNLVDLEMQLAYGYMLYLMQGSDAKNTIAILSSHATSLERSWLYTAIAKSSEYVILLGESDVLEKASLRRNRTDEQQIVF